MYGRTLEFIPNRTKFRITVYFFLTDACIGVTKSSGVVFPYYYLLH